MSYHQRYPPIVAPQVCRRCKERKRKCDKLLPQCSRCERDCLTCSYAPDDKSKSSDTIGPGRQMPAKDSRKINYQIPLSGALYPSVADHRAATDVLSSSFLLSSLSLAMLGAQSDAAETLTAQIFDLVASQSESTSILTMQYFQTVNFWLPIISAESFDRDLGDANAKSSVEVAFVLLCMCLIVRMPSQHDEMRDSVYFSAKALHLGLSSAGKPSLRLIQGGILITLYEQGHGYIEAAHMSHSNCAVMWATLRGQRSQDKGENPIYTEEGRLGWAIVLLESFSIICANSHDLHHNVQRSNAMTALPKYQEIWCNTAYLPPLPVFTAILSDRPTLALASFYYASQAALILGQTQKVISKRFTGPDFDADARLLEMEQQKLLKTLFEYATRQWEECCVAIALCLSSIFALQRTLYRIEPSVITDNRSRRAAAVLSIRTALNICLDISRSRSLTPPQVECATMAPSAVFSTYQAALCCLELGEDISSDQSWHGHMKTILETIERASQRWGVAGYYLTLIDESSSNSSINQPNNC